MSYKKNRQSSVPDNKNNVFSVGDGVHWGYNGDAYPGTILYISDSGRKVLVSRDKYKVIDSLGGYVEGDRVCEFTTVPLPIDKCDVWTLYKDGFWRRESSKSQAWTLRPNRRFAQNPSF